MKLSDIISSSKSKTSTIRRSLIYKEPSLTPYQIQEVVQHAYDDCLISINFSEVVDPGGMIVNGYYCYEEDEIELELFFNNREDQIVFINDLINLIKETFIHEMIHKLQHSRRDEIPYYAVGYRASPDEIDAYGASIAHQLLRHFSLNDAINYLKTYSKKKSVLSVSTDLYGYRNESKSIIKRLLKKIFKYLSIINNDK